jgi:hypothetical protein
MATIITLFVLLFVAYYAMKGVFKVLGTVLSGAGGCIEDIAKVITALIILAILGALFGAGT